MGSGSRLSGPSRWLATETRAKIGGAPVKPNGDGRQRPAIELVWGQKGGQVKQIFRRAFKTACSTIDLVSPAPDGVTVLIYHRVGAGSGVQVDLDTHLFDQQMAELAASGSVISLTQAVDDLNAGGGPGGSRTVVTFDDGTPDFVDNALPILVKHGIPATLYLATGFVEDGLGFWQPDDAPLTWSALGEVMATGLVEIGSHTHRHKLLDRLAGPEVVDELDRSVDLIGEHLGVRARHFAYPKAIAPSAPAQAQVKARFDSAALAGTRTNPWSGTDVYRLARSPIQRSDDMRWFRKKAAGGMHAEDRVRDLVNRRKYAVATS